MFLFGGNSERTHPPRPPTHTHPVRLPRSLLPSSSHTSLTGAVKRIEAAHSAHCSKVKRELVSNLDKISGESGFQKIVGEFIGSATKQVEKVGQELRHRQRTREATKRPRAAA